MKICIPSTGASLDSMVDPRFGRSQFLVFVDSKDDKIIKTIPNDNLSAMRGAGIAVSQIAVDNEADAVIVGNLGPNALTVLKAAKIKIYSGVFGLTIRQALEKIKNKQLKEDASPTVNSHFGIGGGGLGRGFGNGPRGNNRQI